MVRVTIKNDSCRENAVVIVKHEGNGTRVVHELSDGQATSFDISEGETIECIERTQSLTQMEDSSPVADPEKKADSPA